MTTSDTIRDDKLAQNMVLRSRWPHDPREGEGVSHRMGFAVTFLQVFSTDPSLEFEELLARAERLYRSDTFEEQEEFSLLAQTIIKVVNELDGSLGQPGLDLDNRKVVMLSLADFANGLGAI